MFNTTIADGVYTNTAEGTYTFKDIIVYVRDNIHRWEQSPLVWDLTKFNLSVDAEPGDMIRDQLSKSMDLAERRWGKRTAFVAKQDYEYGMFRMYCALSECLKYPLEMKAFRSLAEAQAWVKGDA